MDAKTGKPKGFWVLNGNPDDGEPLALDLPGPGAALAVFSFEEEARLFVGLRDAADALRPAFVTAGGLRARLAGRWSGFGSVALDPIPEPEGGVLLPFTTTSRGRFVRFLRSRQGGPRPR